MRKDSKTRLIKRCNGNSQDNVGGNEGSTVIVVEQDKVWKAMNRCLGPLNNDRSLCHHRCLQGVPPRISCRCGHVCTGLLEVECYLLDPELTVAIDGVERKKEAAATINTAKRERQQGGDSYVPSVALRMFWYNKKREGNYPPQGSNYPWDFWKREEIN